MSKIILCEIVPGHTVELDKATIAFCRWPKGRSGVYPEAIMEIGMVYCILSPIEQPFMIDVGAHVGAYTLLTALLPNMRCAAFEPNPWTFDVLRKNLELNGVLDRVNPHQYAIGDMQGNGVLKVPTASRSSGLSTLGDPRRFDEWEDVNVGVDKLDALDWPKVDFIKIDVEGGELDVLRGAKETISEHHPLMLIECAEKNTVQFGYSPGDTAEMLATMNYKTVQIGQNDLLAVYCG